MSPPGLESFSFTGSAYDTPGETLRYYLPSLPYGFTFNSTVGNPAYFTLGASGLTYQYIGTYSVTVGVYDDNQFTGSAGAAVTVHVVPEPSVVAMLVAVFIPVRQRLC